MKPKEKPKVKSKRRSARILAFMENEDARKKTKAASRIRERTHEYLEKEDALRKKHGLKYDVLPPTKAMPQTPFTKALITEMEEATKHANREMNRALYGSGTGSLFEKIKSESYILNPKPKHKHKKGFYQRHEKTINRIGKWIIIITAWYLSAHILAYFICNKP